MKIEKDFLGLFKHKKPIIGMIHLKGDSDEEVLERAKEEISIYVDNGIDGIIMEDYYGDYYQLVKAIEYIKSLKLDVPIGVNCLNIDAMGFELANTYKLDFIQIDSVIGHVQPRDEAALQEFLKLYRSRTEAALIGGVRFKYQPMLSTRTLEEDLQTAKHRCDAIAVTENATGQETSMDKIRAFRNEIGNHPLVVAAGVTCENVTEQLMICDAAIVGSYFKDTRKDTGDVSARHVREFMDKVKELRCKLND
ncbi:putative TIM-barrel enzyme [Breznakia sp. PF5-3]|uniref:BtpA/SgcQ family protein n=1 Tax=unclassified Breznakia TaxID=2623764 RepID=UPI002406A560|nr:MULTISPECIES: BtpA/SgcQ family protein [unclassified Breznakia]MDF9825404.1 putative TIM-barrel enzyme [Breznakia sp. PM6-1]MDF9836282.1 putative TIM-barrel enzyme [Breznakia sp. PF5-3]MDF9837566.1 putative TIM-barrel enzyme [Breznakia sp. PFB2-8]MDF9860179.1 putative TIM-barrel enzyme [Breznakia sp. PH5-24]